MQMFLAMRTMLECNNVQLVSLRKEFINLYLSKYTWHV